MAIEGIEKFPKEYKPLYINTKLIRSNPYNPRTEVDKESDEQLRQSIGIRGVETPIHVRPIDEDEKGHLYEVYDGDRRLKAAISAKIATVPVLILSKTDDEVLEFGLVSTIRRGLSDVEIGPRSIKIKARWRTSSTYRRRGSRT
jgi:ParB/RepB/Spo0J family partition protein